MNVFFAPHPPVAIPDIGGGNERWIRATVEGFTRIAQGIREIGPSTIIFVTPHGNAFKDALSMLDESRVEGDFSMFGYEKIGFAKDVNMSLTEKIHRGFLEEEVPSVLLKRDGISGYGERVALDHGVMVPMYYIDQYYDKYNIVHITSSFASARMHFKAGEVIRKIVEAEGKRVVVLSSGDLSHALKEEGPYQYHPYGEIFDSKVVKAIEEGNPAELLNLKEQEIEDAAQCGLRSYALGFGYAGKAYKSDVYSYEGPFGVGYLTGTLFKDEEK